MKNADKAYTDWHQFEADRELIIEIDNFKLSDQFIRLGTLPEIAYKSDKWQKGNPVEYLHKFGRKKPYLLAHPTARIMLIVGGGWKITPRGIEG